MKPNSIVPDHTPAGLRTSIELCVKALRGTKKIDLFETARVVRTIPIAEQVEILKGFVAEGLFDHVGLSECSAQSLREINALMTCRHENVVGIREVVVGDTLTQ